MKRISALLAVVAMLVVGSLAVGSPAVASGVDTPPGQTVYGKGPVGVLPGTLDNPWSPGILYTRFYVKDRLNDPGGAGIDTWFNTYGARCYYVGLSIVWDDGDHVAGWVCMVHREFVGHQVPPGVPLTVFYPDTFHFGSSLQPNPAPTNYAFYRESQSVSTHKYSGIYLKHYDVP